MNYTTFEDFAISEEIVTALKALRYFKPTQVQQEVIPLTLKGKDIIVESQTGSGKTVSFGVPLCESVNWEENRPQALILVPTRELALQVKEDITNIGRLKRIKATAVFGKTSFDTQKSELRQKSHIVVGTPGRVLDHLQKGTMKFDKIRYLVLDEADEMLNMGFIEQVEAIIDFLPKQRQTLLFSATMPNEVVRLASFYMKNDRVSVKMESDEASKPKILQSFIRVQESGKPKQLLDLLTVENPDSCIIFCNTQEAVNGLYTFLSKAGLPIDKMHGGMVQDDRTAVMEDFRKGRLRYLVATDVAARGIDVDNVTHVVNYDVPEEKESFIHRTGRTGRAGKTGIALTLVTPNEERSWQAVQDFAQQEITEINPPSARFVQHHKATFEKKLQERPVIKQARNRELNKDITKVYFNGGKKKKLRAIDFVGTLTNIPGIDADDIGIITIQENVTYIEILNGKGPFVISEMQNRTVKGKALKVHKAKK
ncbi:DEAD/DEAH box helicase [Trichococcus shcherbakoviae]|uniref:ATP-dependent RNA helicase DbpA n=1 Tax=Trichococcus shcherbakoviae subsp. psychrophilus TaxID=2585775 RepID=A0A5C5EAS0_9LACT|nr:DEAD/DEAH box helicase [Trichococcus shcherbakoviae]OUL09842.1 RNA helicase [Sedimentibacter sp. SX930]TNV70297.1 DEAD/DEAH box helicase [Trichococcus shcherbakoviae subsp. psychrophilus]